MAENKAAPHSILKDGIYYFNRRVPKDFQRHYISQKISFSLRLDQSPQGQIAPNEPVSNWTNIGIYFR